MANKRIIISVITDLATDQRIHKVATYLLEKGAEVQVIGRQFHDSLPLDNREYPTLRLPCRLRKGVFQYLEFNLRLLIQLLRTRGDIYLANDLDTLGPNFMVTKFRNKPLVFDSHEYFTGVPELKNRGFKRWIWKSLEKIILPKIKYAYTVNESIRKLYADEYGIDMQVVRNLPLLNQYPGANESPDLASDSGVILPSERKILIMQGAGINKDRGYEEAVEAMQLLPENFLLVIIGDGNVLPQLKEMVKRNFLEQKVMFVQRVPHQYLKSITKQGWLGLSLDKPISRNNSFSLPNKLFDYIHAGLPVLASGLVEVKKVIDLYNIGTFVNNVTPNAIAEAVLNIYQNENQYFLWKENTVKAALQLNWENEKKELDKVYDQLL